MADSSVPLYVVFDGPPGHEAGRFVDVEDADGKNPPDGSGLEWSQRGDYWLLGPLVAAPAGTTAALSPAPPAISPAVGVELAVVAAEAHSLFTAGQIPPPQWNRARDLIRETLLKPPVREYLTAVAAFVPGDRWPA